MAKPLHDKQLRTAKMNIANAWSVRSVTKISHLFKTNTKYNSRLPWPWTDIYTITFKTSNLLIREAV